jgi:hypothetical protein
MVKRGNPSWAAAIAALVCALGAVGVLAPSTARGDEIKLKDGTKIVGTIVGFEENSFKVKTSYGFAEIQKDQVVSISISDAAKKPDADKKPDAEKKPEPAAEKPATPAKPAKKEATADATPEKPSPSTKPAKTESKAASSTASAAPVPVVTPPPAKTTPAPAVAPAPATVAVAAPPPPKPAPPEPMREEVNGNTYTNDTFGFQMYKPPDWQVIAGARALLPGTITAMGTEDETTYLLIGQETAGKSLASDMDDTDHRLRDIMENFRALGETHINVSGMTVVERRFRGSVDKHDWSGVVVFVPRGTQLYTIFGMTYADTDLVQIQENVIHRAISSLTFIRQ